MTDKSSDKSSDKDTAGTDTTGTDTAGTDTAGTDLSRSHRRRLVASRLQELRGVKIGLAFFGWLTATGTAAILTAFVAAAGTAISVATSTDASSATTRAAQDPKTVGIVGAIILLLILFVAYYCGGYVAGRMARFHGLRQGLAVWLWAVFIAAVVAILAALAGSQYDVLSTLNTFPRIPVSQGNLTTGGLIALIVVAAGSLAGALVGSFAGGRAGMRFECEVEEATRQK